MNSRKLSSLALVLLLLCSLTVAPAMAGTKTKTVVDGVHLLEFDAGPTKLDPKFYEMDPTEDVVVDGDQFYWVRIGSEKAKTLSSNEKVYILCCGAFFAVGGAASALVATAAAPPAGAATGPTLGGSLVIYVVGLGAAIGLIEGAAGGLAANVCPIAEKQFVEKDYRVVASDGTILIGVEKTNKALIAELKKDGLDIPQLQHLSKEGVPIVDKRVYYETVPIHPKCTGAGCV